MNDHDFDEMMKEASDHVLGHHVSLGVSSGIPSLLLPPPIGSGTFVRFALPSGTMYGILTAAHVIEAWLETANNGKCIVLSKPQKGNTVACSCTGLFIFYTPSKVYVGCPDIAFIAFGVDEQLPKHELIENSLFCDLDSIDELGLSNKQIFSGFFRGAAEKRADGLLDTFAALGGGESLISEGCYQYWAIPNTSRQSISGASGAGFWRFLYEKGILRKSLEGVIIAEGPHYDYIKAMAVPYLYETFLPGLKNFFTSKDSYVR
jgi:hypothetical protein